MEKLQELGVIPRKANKAQIAKSVSRFVGWDPHKRKEHEIKEKIDSRESKSIRKRKSGTGKFQTSYSQISRQLSDISGRRSTQETRRSSKGATHRKRSISDIDNEEMITCNPAGEVDHRILSFQARHVDDVEYYEEEFAEDLNNFRAGEFFIPKYEGDDNPDYSQQPSYRGFIIPLDLIAAERLKARKRKYEEQFAREIDNLINFQNSALEASMFVRIMAYTTIWPPLHNRAELEYTSKNFFSDLTIKEKRRLNYIMTHDFN